MSTAVTRQAILNLLEHLRKNGCDTSKYVIVMSSEQYKSLSSDGSDIDFNETPVVISDSLCSVILIKPRDSE